MVLAPPITAVVISPRSRPLDAAHLEQVGEIGGEIDGQPAGPGIDVEIMDGDALVAGALPEEFRPPDMQGFARQHDGAVLVDIGIGEIHGQDDIVVLHRAGQKQRPLAVDQKLDTRQIARVVVKKTARRQAWRHAITQGIEHGEGVTLLEGARPALLNGFRRLNMKSRNIFRRVREGFSLHLFLANAYSAATAITSSEAVSCS